MSTLSVPVSLRGNLKELGRDCFCKHKRTLKNNLIPSEAGQPGICKEIFEIANIVSAS